MASIFIGHGDRYPSPYPPGSREEYDWFCQQQQRQHNYPEHFGAQAQPAPTYLTNPVLLLLEP